MNPPYYFHRNPARKRYLQAEVILCFYNARFDNQISTEQIINVSRRVPDSIKLKIGNIKSMLEEKELHNNSNIDEISGIHQGEEPRKTNWDTIQNYIDYSQNELLNHCCQILSNPTYI